MNQQHCQTRRSFIKRSAASVGLVPIGLNASGGQRFPSWSSDNDSLCHYRQNLPDDELDSLVTGIGLTVFYPNRVKTLPAFSSYAIQASSADEPLMKKIPNTTRWTKFGTFVVCEGDFDKSTALAVITSEYYEIYREWGDVTLCIYGSAVAAVTDGLVIYSPSLFTDLSKERIANVLEKRERTGPTGDPFPAFLGVLNELDASCMCVANFGNKLRARYFSLEPIMDSVQGVGQSATPLFDEMETTTAIYFEDDADDHVAELESALADETYLGFTRLTDPTIETSGNVATVTETQEASEALNI